MTTATATEKEMTMSEIEVKEVTSVEKSLDRFNELIIDDIDFGVKLVSLQTYGSSDTIRMPEHKATIRVNPDGSEQPLWVVGTRYEVVDHREIIKQFASALEKAEIKAEVDYKIFKNGCRIFSIFTINQRYKVGEEMVRPFFALTTSHDGSLKVGFMMGAKTDKDKYIVVSKKLYGDQAKHTRGINIERTLIAIENAVEVLTDEVIPMWERMKDITLDEDKAKELVERAIKKGIISKRSALDLPFVSTSGRGRDAKVEKVNPSSVWNIYTGIVDEVSKSSGTKRSTEERAFWRNTEASEFFTKVMKSGELTKSE